MSIKNLNELAVSTHMILECIVFELLAPLISVSSVRSICKHTFEGRVRGIFAIMFEDL